jgi:hypothetical protein
MRSVELRELDLMPPAFSEGLYDWSRGDGTPESAVYADMSSADVRIVENDSDFGTCLELRKTDSIQRLRYMGEMPVRAGTYLRVSARLKVTRGPQGAARIAAWPGGKMGRPVRGLETCAALAGFDGYGRVHELSAVIGPATLPGVDLVWRRNVLYAHVGLDILGPNGGVFRIENLRVHDVTREITGMAGIMPGFGPADLQSQTAERCGGGG